MLYTYNFNDIGTFIWIALTHINNTYIHIHICNSTSSIPMSNKIYLFVRMYDLARARASWCYFYFLRQWVPHSGRIRFHQLCLKKRFFKSNYEPLSAPIPFIRMAICNFISSVHIYFGKRILQTQPHLFFALLIFDFCFSVLLKIYCLWSSILLYYIPCACVHTKENFVSFFQLLRFGIGVSYI